MQLKVYRALWGVEGHLDAQLDRIAEAGYDGIEAGVPDSNIAEFAQKTKSRGLSIIGMLFCDDPECLKSGLGRAAELGVDFVNVHSGKDWMTFDQGCAYFEGALEAETRSGLRVCHETHRGPLLCSPWATAAYLQKFDDLKIVADFSHFTCVCESLLDDQAGSLATAISRAHHIHGRVGYEQGPQVPDPRAPEYSRHLERFELWWDRILEAHQKRGATFMTFTPEFGPAPYMPTLPFTNVPVADLWDICLHMADRARSRWPHLA